MKKVIFFFLLLSTSIRLFGQEVTESLAMQVANNYYEKVQFDNTGDGVPYIKEILKTRTNRSIERISPMGKADMWLVPVPDGWVLVSTNMKTPPILAHYQTDQKPDFDNIPPATKVLLNWYEKVIAFAKDSCPDCIVNYKWASLQQSNKRDYPHETRAMVIISPLIETRWNQGGGGSCESNKYYNKFCPPTNKPNADYCNKSPVGCTAVGMAQIMKYWQWPFAAQVPTTSGGLTKELHFYDWNNMPIRISEYTPMEYVDMTAGLLRDCGYMAHMDYKDSSSTAIDIFAQQAFISCGFDENISLKRKWNTPGWRALLLSDLQAGRPVYYSAGNDKLEGHVFIVDGYDSDDKYHINFGWGGGYDGYYQIDTIDIVEIKRIKIIESIIGNDTTFSYYNDTIHEYYHVYQGAIFGIQPAPNCGPLAFSNKTVSSDFMYASEGELSFSGVTFQNVNRGEATSATQVRLSAGTTVLTGSNIRFGIKEVPCNSPSSVPPPIREDSEEVFVQQTPANINKVIKGTLSIFPNPAIDHITISCSEPIERTTIYNLKGMVVLLTTDTEIDVSALPAGIYLVRSQTTQGEVYQAKMVHL